MKNSALWRGIIPIAAVLWYGATVPRAFAALPGGTLDPALISKYQAPLVIPPAMPPTATLTGPTNGPIDYYEIAVRQFQQQILPPGLPVTTVWSYGSVDSPRDRSTTRPSPSRRAGGPRCGSSGSTTSWTPSRPVPAPPPSGRPDAALGQPARRRPRPGLRADVHEHARAATPGPVPIVTHLHGGHSAEESDGFAEAWYLPARDRHPRRLRHAWARCYAEFKAKAAGGTGAQAWTPGTAVFQYDERPARRRRSGTTTTRSA